MAADRRTERQRTRRGMPGVQRQPPAGRGAYLLALALGACMLAVPYILEHCVLVAELGQTGSPAAGRILALGRHFSLLMAALLAGLALCAPGAPLHRHRRALGLGALLAAVLAVGLLDADAGRSGAGGPSAPFDITVQDQSGSGTPSDLDAALRSAGFDTSRELAWQRTVPFYYNDPSVTGIEEAGAAIRLSDYDALLERQGIRSYAGPLPHLQEDRRIALVTGELGLRYVVVPDSMASALRVRRQVWSADYAGMEGTQEQLLAVLRPMKSSFATQVDTRREIQLDQLGQQLQGRLSALYLAGVMLMAAVVQLVLWRSDQGAKRGAERPQRRLLPGRRPIAGVTTL